MFADGSTYSSLHSTMFLLKLLQNLRQVHLHSALHSTMFLLKPRPYALRNRSGHRFTFHNVSIKTCNSVARHYHATPLHSTMFLLKLLAWVLFNHNQYFTFHNVSIKTFNFATHLLPVFSLHSTMFLLKRVIISRIPEFYFTLHSTMFLLKRSTPRSSISWSQIFTFHNVSIKTRHVLNYPDRLRLYIPQCFY